MGIHLRPTKYLFRFAVLRNCGTNVSTLTASAALGVDVFGVADLGRVVLGLCCDTEADTNNGSNKILNNMV
jgi:hypothetical protein